ncbi:MAG: PDZ domain-containing protein [Cyclobacteriaceae bacterium]|jgi:carboxyl-terminal processing protease|nr:PDZ domain-containing protein [Cyclobacteriaceae bacterium]
MKLRMKNALFGILIVAAAIVGFSFTAPAEKYFDIAKSLDIFATLFKEVNAYYVDEVDPKDLVSIGIDGMLQSLDPYTDYIPEENLEEFSIQTTGQYAGIGALIGIINNKTVITNPYDGFPANKAGLRVGDQIISVDGVNIEGKNTPQVSSLLKGKPNTEVKLVVRRPGKNGDLTININRQKIKLSNVAYQGMVGEDIGYIKLDDFTPGAGKEVEAAVLDLKKQGAKKLILDLRDNPGGLLYEAVNIVSLFIPKGLEVVSTKGKVKDWNKTYVSLNNPIDTNTPLAVLTSGGSASAAEIVAGALQDYDRAILVGQKTFGKGLVQTTRQLSYNAQLKVTTAKYYIPSGRCIQALDYAHRNKDGSVDKFADSLKTEFLTKGGRKVYDGGGLDPDVEVDNEYLSPAAIQLITSGHIFDYATIYVAEHPQLNSVETFKLSDEEYKKFGDWLASKKFTFSSELEEQMKQLEEVAKKERSYGEIQSQLKSLKNQIEQNRSKDLMRYKDEIGKILEEEIAFHFGLIKAQVEMSLQRDKELKEAVKNLQEETQYKNLLSSK